WNAAEEAEFAQWLNEANGNLIVFLRMQAAWQEADRLRVLGAGFERGVVPNLEDFRASPFFNHVRRAASTSSEPVSPRTSTRASLVRWAAAASVLLLIGLGFWGWASLDATTAYSTPIGVTAAVALRDGSRITLNTASEVRVAISEAERRIDLEQGEAFFEVAKDPEHPFVVRAADQRIVAIGTKFSVRRERNDLRVVVTEGAVRIQQDGVGLQAPSTRLSAGDMARVADGRMAIQGQTRSEVQELLSWRSGYLVFHETSLAAAVAEFNRYNTVKLVIEDPTVATTRISGNFRYTDIDSFVRLLEEGFPLMADRQEERIVLIRRSL
ncbi:MAG: FecR family protein, partial [Steroidobacteraceae bacterium]